MEMRTQRRNKRSDNFERIMRCSKENYDDSLYSFNKKVAI